ncbi:MAG: AMP nucleosidase, partial [Acidimicrobiales bacterium]
MTVLDEDGSQLGDAAAVEGAVRRLLDGLDAICSEGEYASVEVVRPWSGPNPTITGEFSNVS